MQTHRASPYDYITLKTFTQAVFLRSEEDFVHWSPVGAAEDGTGGRKRAGATWSLPPWVFDPVCYGMPGTPVPVPVVGVVPPLVGISMVAFVNTLIQ